VTGWQTKEILKFQPTQCEEASREVAITKSSAEWKEERDRYLELRASEGHAVVKRQRQASWLMCIRRLCTLVLFSVPVVAAGLICRMLDKEWAWERYRKMCLYLVRRYGAVAVKLGQWAASRKDLFGDQVCALLPGELHMNVAEGQISATDLVRVREECHACHADLSDAVPLEELGSGCVASVFKGKKTDGTDVVVKILRAGVREKIDADLVVMKWLLSAAHFVAPQLRWLCLDEALFEFCSFMQMQTDFTIEGENLKKLRRNFETSAFVRVPEVHGTPSPDILVQSYVGGYHLADLLAPEQTEGLLRNPQIRKLISLELGRSFCKMLFVDNFTHLDMHPGNIKILFLNDPTQKRGICPDWLWDRLPSLSSSGLDNPDNADQIRWRVPLPVLGLVDMMEARWASFTGSAAFELVLLDVGMVLHMSTQAKKTMLGACSAAVQGHSEEAGEELLSGHAKRGRVGGIANPAGFIDDMGSLLVCAVRWGDAWSRFFDSYDKYEHSGTAEYLSIATRLFSRYQVRMDPEIYCACAAVALVEGSLRSCYADTNIARCALPYLLPNMSWLHHLTSGQFFANLFGMVPATD